MRRYSEAIKADVRRRMSPPNLQSVARISEELGIHVITLYKWRKTWCQMSIRLMGCVNLVDR
jgi:transposase-like protein